MMKKRNKFKLHVDGLVYESGKVEITVSMSGLPCNLSEALTEMMRKSEDFEEIVYDAVKDFVKANVAHQIICSILLH